MPQRSKPLVTRIPGTLDPAFHVQADAAAFGHREHLGDTAGPETSEHPEHDVGPIRYLEARRIGDDAPDIPRGKGICDKTDPHSARSFDRDAGH